MYKLKTYAPYGLNKRDVYEAFYKFKIDHILSIYNKVIRGSLIMIFCSSFLSSSFYLFESSNFLFLNFICHLLTIYLNLTIIYYYYYYCFYYHCYYYCNYYYNCQLINITVTVILEKSSGREFHARNSRSMVHPYSSR